MKKLILQALAFALMASQSHANITPSQNKTCTLAALRGQAHTPFPIAGKEPFLPFDEVHAVGIYEGAPNPKFPKAQYSNVCVDRPGKNVLLILGSNQGVSWKIDLKEGTKLSGILLRGYKPETSVVTLHGKHADTIPVIQVESLNKMPHHIDGPGFREFVIHTTEDIGSEITTFSGGYRATPDGFYIGKDLKSHKKLDRNYLNNKISQPKLSPRLSRAFARKSSDDEWEFTHDGFKSNISADIIPTDRDIRISFPTTQVAADPNGHSLFGASQQSGTIFRVDLISEKWFKLSGPSPHAYQALHFDPQEKKIYAVSFDLNNRKPNVQIQKIDPISGKKIITDFSKLWPGLYDLFDPRSGEFPDTRIWAVDEGKVLVHASFEQKYPKKVFLSRTWLIDPESKDVHLLNATDEKTNPEENEAWRLYPQPKVRHVKRENHKRVQPFEAVTSSSPTKAGAKLERPSKPTSKEQGWAEKVNGGQQEIVEFTEVVHQLFSKSGNYAGLDTDFARSIGLIPSTSGIQVSGSPSYFEIFFPVQNQQHADALRKAIISSEISKKLIAFDLEEGGKGSKLEKYLKIMVK